MAQRLEVYRGGDGAKTTTKGPKKFKNQKKGNVAQVKGSSSGGTVQVVQAMKKQQKKGKAGSGSGGKKVKRGGRKKIQCHNCGGDTSCGTVRSGRKSRRNFVLPREKSSPAPSPIQAVTGMEPLDRQ